MEKRKGTIKRNVKENKVLLRRKFPSKANKKIIYLLIIVIVLFIVSLLVIGILNKVNENEKVSLSSGVKIAISYDIYGQDKENSEIKKINEGNYQIKKNSMGYTFINKNELFVFSKEGKYMWSWIEMSEKISVETINDLNEDGYEELVVAPKKSAIPSTKIIDGKTGNLISSIITNKETYKNNIPTSNEKILKNGENVYIFNLDSGYKLNGINFNKILETESLIIDAKIIGENLIVVDLFNLYSFDINNRKINIYPITQNDFFIGKNNIYVQQNEIINYRTVPYLLIFDRYLNLQNKIDIKDKIIDVFNDEIVFLDDNNTIYFMNSNGHKGTKIYDVNPADFEYNIIDDKFIFKQNNTIKKIENGAATAIYRIPGEFLSKKVMSIDESNIAVIDEELKRLTILNGINSIVEFNFGGKEIIYSSDNSDFVVWDEFPFSYKYKDYKGELKQLINNKKYRIMGIENINDINSDGEDEFVFKLSEKDNYGINALILFYPKSGMGKKITFIPTVGEKLVVINDTTTRINETDKSIRIKQQEIDSLNRELRNYQEELSMEDNITRQNFINNEIYKINTKVMSIQTKINELQNERNSLESQRLNFESPDLTNQMKIRKYSFDKNNILIFLSNGEKYKINYLPYEENKIDINSYNMGFAGDINLDGTSDIIASKQDSLNILDGKTLNPIWTKDITNVQEFWKIDNAIILLTSQEIISLRLSDGSELYRKSFDTNNLPIFLSKNNKAVIFNIYNGGLLIFGEKFYNLNLENLGIPYGSNLDNYNLLYDCNKDGNEEVVFGVSNRNTEYKSKLILYCIDPRLGEKIKEIVVIDSEREMNKVNSFGSISMVYGGDNNKNYVYPVGNNLFPIRKASNSLILEIGSNVYQFSYSLESVNFLSDLQGLTSLVLDNEGRARYIVFGNGLLIKEGKIFTSFGKEIEIKEYNNLNIKEESDGFTISGGNNKFIFINDKLITFTDKYERFIGSLYEKNSIYVLSYMPEQDIFEIIFSQEELRKNISFIPIIMILLEISLLIIWIILKLKWKKKE